MGEVLDGAVDEVCSYADVLDSALNYPVYVFSLSQTEAIRA